MSPRNPPRAVGTVATAAVGLVVLTGLVAVDPGPVPGLDTAITAALVANRGGDAVMVWSVITWFGAGPVLAVVGVLAAVVLALRRRWSEAAGVLAAMALVFACWGLLRLTVARPRPDGGLVPTDTDVGFPSGHASNAAAFAVLTVAVLAPHLHRRGRVSLVVAVALFAAAVGLSRVVLGVHYPSDVLAGWALAVTVTAPAYTAAHILINRSQRTEPRTPDRA